MDVVRVYHFHNGKPGGVFSVIKNIIKFRQLNFIEHHIIYTIEKSKSIGFVVPEIDGVASQQVFIYLKSWNLYFVHKKLMELLHDDNSVIIANDEMELGMAANLGLSNPIIQLLHGDYDFYYNLARTYQGTVNNFLCVSSKIFNTLNNLIDSDKIIDWRFPISDGHLNNCYSDDFTIAFYVGDLKDENKNYNYLPVIDKILVANGVFVKWKIAGGGMSPKENQVFWGDQSVDRVNFMGFLNDGQIDNFLKNCNCMILPSRFEGLPVSVVECMKRGIIPFTSYWNGSLRDLIIDGETGFYSYESKAIEFAQKIIYFKNNKYLRDNMPRAVKSIVDEKFNNYSSIQEFENLVITMKTTQRKAAKLMGSRLDNKLFPNFVVTAIRSSSNNNE